MTNARATPEVADRKPDEMLEWRDLQNTQMTALQDVWDNLEDECWNEVARPSATLLAKGQP